MKEKDLSFYAVYYRSSGAKWEYIACDNKGVYCFRNIKTQKARYFNSLKGFYSTKENSTLRGEYIKQLYRIWQLLKI